MSLAVNNSRRLPLLCMEMWDFHQSYVSCRKQLSEAPPSPSDVGLIIVNPSGT